MRKYSWLTLFIFGMANAQSKLDNAFYSDQKIWVVVAVLVIIFLGILLYLVRVERKINKLENNED